jgi:hypothetical protein
MLKLSETKKYASVGGSAVVVGEMVVSSEQLVKAWSLSNIVIGVSILSKLLVIISSELLFKDNKLLNIVVGL